MAAVTYDWYDDPVLEVEPPPDSVAEFYRKLRALNMDPDPPGIAEHSEALSDRYLKPDGSER